MELNLYNLYKEIIFESISREAVLDAINKHVRVRIYYAGDDNTATGWRLIEPYVFGLTKKGNPVLRAYQLFGDTKTEIPGWKLFRLDRILKWEPLKVKFNTPINERDPSAPPFNPNGDKSMIGVPYIIKF
jgi:predicted DNA-binding transcriptional regulator YafY